MTGMSKFTVCVASVLAVPALTQSTCLAETSNSTSASPVAYVYVQTHQGVDVYDASSSGKLTLVKGSPFAESGQMGAVNGKYLISVGTDYLHSYAIGSNGAVGKQASEINTQSYGGSQCGNTTGLASFMDHSGHYFYQQLSGVMDGGSVSCVAWQSFGINSSGVLGFLNSIEYSGDAGHDATPSSTPTVNSSDKFAYGVFTEFGGYSTTDFSTLQITSAGHLEVINNFKETDPTTNPNLANGPWTYFPWLAQADPANHLAVLLYPTNFPSGQQEDGPYQLASYTINSSTGSVSSTNTWENMPTPAVQNVSVMDMSPSGKLLAVAGHPGLQIFHFNGSAPITQYSSTLLPSVNIDQLGWDNSNHLYALSYDSGQLHVFNVTTTSISEAAGSPYSIANTYGQDGLIVVPK